MNGVSLLAAPVEVEEGESPAGGPAVVVSLNPLCRSVPYTVGLSFGVRENSGETCLPQQNVTANILPGTPVILPINVTTLPLADGQQYCFTVPQLNIEGDLPTASTSTCTDTREEKESISTGVAVAITLTISVLVGGERGERKKKKKREELVAAIYEEPVHSVETAIPLSENQAYGQIQIDIPLGTVCVECVVDGVVDTATTTFLIGNSPITSLDGGVLVVDDTSMTFQASTALTLRCVSGSGAVRQASVFLDVYLPPIITGATTVNEGGTLSLSCDSTNSNREPSAQWFDKDGQMVSSSGILNIPNIMRSQAGSYTCRTFPPNLDNSTSTTVTVVVQLGVVIGSCGTLFAIRRGGERGERKKKKKEEFVAAFMRASSFSGDCHSSL
ncbi:hypothetical protein GBAR_LOCUS27223 [Geodia barretti]|uniref:Ig-like domain-containing protein n=1 Tax=Geodia barretti TaxID=519541 RepID=A0AA35TJV2_GEOBA|nr:hypothetical protein GBAR_LOCUS27223 [Geodia barretti]